MIDFSVKLHSDNYDVLSTNNTQKENYDEKMNDLSFRQVLERITEDKPETVKDKSEINNENDNPKSEIGKSEKKKVADNKDGRNIKDDNTAVPEKLKAALTEKETVNIKNNNLTDEIPPDIKEKIIPGKKIDDQVIVKESEEKEKPLSGNEKNISSSAVENRFRNDFMSILNGSPEKKSDIAADLFKINKKRVTPEKSESKSDKKEIKKETTKQIFRILDLRTKRSQPNENISSVNKTANIDNASELNGNSINSKISSDAAARDVFLTARNWAEPGAFVKTEQLPAQSQVLENLRNHGNSEIIKNAQILLKDNDSGEIKLLMKPENLGYVRIKLTMEDNNIAGRIIVDNYNTKEIFENNLENLLRNFRDSGFSTATLDVSVGGEKGQKERMNSGAGNFVKKIIKDVEEQGIVRYGSYDKRLVDLVI